jgi:formylglycine-generating enzyme required for sulfatase activity
VPVLLDDVEPPLAFELIQAAPLVGWEGEQSHPGLERLLQDIAAIVGHPPDQKEQGGSKTEERKRADLFSAIRKFVNNHPEVSATVLGLVVLAILWFSYISPKIQTQESSSNSVKIEQPEVLPQPPVGPAKTPVQAEKPVQAPIVKIQKPVKVAPMKELVPQGAEGEQPAQPTKKEPVPQEAPVVQLTEPKKEPATQAASAAQPAEQKKEQPKGPQAEKVASAPSFSLPKQMPKEITGKDGAPMVPVPAGEFLYGDDKRRESADAFYMDKYEVTTTRYAAFMQATGREEPKYWNKVRFTSHGDRPVVGVTWYDADAYCRYYGKRLPTEQEWEKAARGTDGRKYPWGNEAPTSRHANFNRCCDFQDYGVLVNVGTLEDGKSPYGIYDLAGNVWEWTSSDYDSSHKVVRGGAWASSASTLGSSDRVEAPPGGWGDIRGFRCVQNAR